MRGTTAQGFKKLTKTVAIHPGQVMVENLGLEIEALSEEVTVTSDTQGIETTQSSPAEEIKQNTSLANYKVPRRVEFAETELPKGGTGKILKKNLRERFWAHQERAVG